MFSDSKNVIKVNENQFEKFVWGITCKACTWMSSNSAYFHRWNHCEIKRNYLRKRMKSLHINVLRLGSLPSAFFAQCCPPMLPLCLEIPEIPSVNEVHSQRGGNPQFWWIFKQFKRKYANIFLEILNKLNWRDIWRDFFARCCRHVWRFQRSHLGTKYVHRREHLNLGNS